MIEIHPVRTRRELKRFVTFPWKIYQGDPNWVPPLVMDRLSFFNPRKNPFFQHSEADLFMATDNGEPAGRIAAIRYSRHLETHGDSTGFFGFFECVDDATVANALFERASQWVADRGLTRIRGPMNFTVNDEAALLVEGFDRPPVVMMTYNPPYYERLVTGYGFKKAQDLFAYYLDAPRSIPERLVRAWELMGKREGIRIRTINMKDFDAEVERIHQIHEQAWGENWGSVPLTRDEIRRIAKDLKLILDPDLVLMVEDGDKPVGVSVTLPDINQALKYANGRLFPAGLVKILWHKRKIDAVRVFIMGVVKGYRRRGLDAAMYYKTMEAALKKGYKWGEMSWVLESNTPMRRVLDRLGIEVYKTYRIYDKEI
ncbi:MAG: N-acetyltransferase [Fidelibacterota bacterium]